MRWTLALCLYLSGCAQDVADATWRAVEADYANPAAVAERFDVVPPADPDAIGVAGGHPRLVVGPNGVALDTFSVWLASSASARVQLAEAGWPWRRHLLDADAWREPEPAIRAAHFRPLREALREVQDLLAPGPDRRPRLDLVVDAGVPHAAVSVVLQAAYAAGFVQVGLVGQGTGRFQARVVPLRALGADPPDCRQVAVHAHRTGARAEVMQRPWELGARGCMWVPRDASGHLDPGAGGALLPTVRSRCPEVLVGGGPEVSWTEVHEAVRLVSMAGGKPLLVASTMADHGACLGDLLGLLP